MSRIIALLSFVLVATASEGGGPGGGGGGPVAPGAPGGGEQAPAGGMSWLIWLFPLALLVILIWSSSRAQKREQRQRQEMIDSVKLGDKVVTIGGLHGEVVRRGENTVDIRVGEAANSPVLTFNSSAVATVAGEHVPDSDKK